MLIASMDACFGLVRKKSSGKSCLPPRHPCTMFYDQSTVDEFVDEYTSNAQQANSVSKTANDFQLHVIAAHDNYFCDFFLTIL